MNRTALAIVLIGIAALSIIATAPVWASAVVVGDSWVSKAPMQEARGNLGVAVVNGKIYAIGGSVDTLYASYAYTGQVGTNEEYDPETDTWVFKASMPTARSCFAIAVCQGKIYCIGGYLANSSNAGVNEVYDPETDTWETKASMPTARRLLQANVVGDKIYLIGGGGGGSVPLTCEVYDPATDSWTTKAPIPTGTTWYASAVVDGKIYIIRANRTQIYDAETDTWSSGADAPYNTEQGAAGVTTGALAPKRIYVMGVTKPIAFGDPPPCLTQVYNPASDSWINGTSMPTNRVNFGVAVVNDTIYVVGGHTHDSLGFIYPSAANEQYTPIGYGTPEPTDQTPTLSPTSYETPDTTAQSQSPLPIYAVAASIAAITIIAITAIALKKKQQKHKLNQPI
jgi:N-acetylneuraminic acid mutarotase